jgi:anti-sigma-K factor RskA
VTTFSHDAARDRLEEYVLDQLPPADRRDLEAHLETCEACRAAVRELSRVVEELALMTEPLPPRPELKSQVLAALAADRRVDAPAQTATVSPRLPSWFPWLATAASIAMIGGAVMLFTMSNREQRTAGELARARSQVQELQGRLDDLAAQADLVTSILTAEDMRPIDLTSSEAGSNVTGRAYWSPANGLLLVADDLPVPPAGRVYQVWLIPGPGAKPLSAGLLPAEGSRRGMLIVPSPPGVSNRGVTIAITDEPPGGLAAPSGQMHLVGSL